MAAPVSSSLFMSLGNAWRLLTLRSDIDDIILELLGHFALDRIYAESDKEAYQHLLTTLLCQLCTVFSLQRVTLPSENQQVGALGLYLGFLASWEVTLRSVEFVLQVVQDGRESLWEAESLRDKYLPEYLLVALRFLSLHPKAPASQRAKDRRERFARIHRSLERIDDGYPGSKSLLWLLCKEVTSCLRNDPLGLALPAKMRYELPDLASDLVGASARRGDITGARLTIRSIPSPIASRHTTSLRSCPPTASLPSAGWPSSWLCEMCPCSSSPPPCNTR